jgi:hypothetical protein
MYMRVVERSIPIEIPLIPRKDIWFTKAPEDQINADRKKNGRLSGTFLGTWLHDGDAVRFWRLDLVVGPGAVEAGPSWWSALW